MRVSSLGYKTDLIFPAFEGEIIDRGDYLAIRTPANPDFYWGNFLLFANPPRVGDIEQWRGLFSEEFAAQPETRHEAFGWDSAAGEEGVMQPFIASGFCLKRDVVMTNRAPRAPSRMSEDVEIRALKTESEWQQALDNQVICREPGFEEAGYRAYRQHEMKRYQRMSLAGRGHWYGAFSDSRLVADLGIFHAERAGRFQSVQTHPDFRCRGVGAALVVKSARHALREHDLQFLVIVAEEGLAPQRLYESIGFKPTEYQVGLERRPPA